MDLRQHRRQHLALDELADLYALDLAQIEKIRVIVGVQLGADVLTLEAHGLVPASRERGLVLVERLQLLNRWVRYDAAFELR